MFLEIKVKEIVNVLERLSDAVRQVVQRIYKYATSNNFIPRGVVLRKTGSRGPPAISFIVKILASLKEVFGK